MSTSFQSSRPVVVDSELPAQTAATNGKALISNGMTASWNTILGMIGTNPGQVPPHQVTNEILPVQAGNSGKVLTTDGANVSWQSQSGGGASLPDQTGNAGKFLTTDGSTTSWNTVHQVPNVSTGNTYDFLHINDAGQVAWTSKFVTSSPSLHMGIASTNADTHDLTALTYPSGSCIVCTSSNPVTVNITLTDSNTYDIGAVVDIIQAGTGQVTVVPAGVTVGAANGLKARVQYSGITLIKIDTTTWVLVGDTTA